MDAQEQFIRLVRIPSVTGSAGEEEACAFLEKLLKEQGIAGERIVGKEGRPNLLAKISAEEPEKEPLILISHIDVVDGKPENWSHPVFGAEVADGRIWGRGTLDTKQLTMMELNAFLHLKGKEKQLNRDVYFLATIDEEGGSTWGMEYVKSVRPALFQGSMVINEGGGFPLVINGKTYMMLTVGEKTVCRVKLSAEGAGGPAAESGSDQPNPELDAAIKRIVAAEKELTCGSHRTYDIMRQIVGSKEWDSSVGLDILHDSGQNQIKLRDAQTGTGGDRIPAHTEAVLEFRLLPYTEVREITEFLDAQIKDLPIRYEVLTYEPGYEIDFKNPHLKQFTKELQAACADEGLTAEVLPMLALGRTDGRFFGREGSMVYGCSPLLPGDSFDVVLPKVHGNDESILTESFAFGCRVLDQVITKETLKED